MNKIISPKVRTLYGLLANRSIALLVFASLLSVLLLVLPATKPFALKHFGVILVLLGVLGVVVLDLKKIRTIRGCVKLIFDAALIAGLVLEIREAAKSDKEVAELNRQAGESRKLAADANERTAKMQLT